MDPQRSALVILPPLCEGCIVEDPVARACEQAIFGGQNALSVVARIGQAPGL